MTAARLSSLLVSLAIGLGGLGACQSALSTATTKPPAPHRIDGDDYTRGVDLVVGQLLEIPLYGNASTGYSWDRIGLPEEGSDEVLVDAGTASLRSSAPVSTMPGAIGAGSTVVYRYRAARTGVTTLRLVYRRSWQTDVPPANTVTLTVRVH